MIMNADTVTKFLKSIGYKVAMQHMTRDQLGYEKVIMPYAADMKISLIVDLTSGTFSFISYVDRIEIAMRDLQAVYYLAPEFIEIFTEMEELFKYILKKVVF